MTRAILQQALDFCVFCWRDVDMNDYAFERLETTIDALRIELAKPEPVAWREFDGEGGYLYYDFEGNEHRKAEWDERYKDSPQYLQGWLEQLFTKEQL